MNIIVCVKEIIDPELPPDQFEIDPDKNRVKPSHGMPLVLNPFDEQAVEAALRIKDVLGGNITILSLGNNLHMEIVKKPLTMGADELILLEDEAFSDLDSWSTAHALASAIKKIGNYDLIICGRQAADWEAGQVGSGMAEILGLPSVTTAKKIEVINGQARVERVTTDGYEIIEATLPALITVSNELGDPRFGTIKGILEAKKKQPTKWKPEDIGIDFSNDDIFCKNLKLKKLGYPPVPEGKCEFIEGETPEDAAIAFAHRLKEAKAI